MPSGWTASNRLTRTICSDSYSKTSLISGALAATGAPASSVAMVGDRGEDVLGAKANGVCAVAVAWGYGSQEELEAARPDITVNSTTELLEFVGRAG